MESKLSAGARARRQLALLLAIVIASTMLTADRATAVEVGSPAGSILVVAPHPDDDVITAAGITSDRPDVTIAYMTNGDTDPGGAIVRQDEAVEAQRILGQVVGSNEDNLVFMGYPDAHLAAVWENAGPAGATNASRGLGLTDWHDYRTGSVGQHADYNKEAMIADMVALIDIRRPAHIFVTSDRDRHTDHATTNLVVDTALAQVIATDGNYGAVVHETVVWHPDVSTSNDHWPQNRDPVSNVLRDLDVDPTANPSLADVGLVWAEREQFVVPSAMQNPDDLINPKSRAIDAHADQGGLDGFIGRWVHRDEIFWAEYVNYPVLSINDATVTEGDDASFSISRSGAHNLAISVTATTSEGTAGSPDDYTHTSQIVSLGVGQAIATFVVPTTEDAVTEPTESFTVTLSSPSSHTTLGNATGTGTINDDEAAGISIDQLDGLRLTEDGGTDSYNVSLATQPTATVTITLTPDSQVTADHATLTFTPATWSTPQPVEVQALDDFLAEANPHSGTITHTASSSDGDYNTLPPTAVAAEITENLSVTGPTTAPTGSPLSFSTDSGADTYAWTVTRDGTQVATGAASDLTFTPNVAGTYTIDATATVGSSPSGMAAHTLNVFADIADSVFVDDIVWLADNGITKGCNPPVNTKFCPNANVTRGQMAAFLTRALGLTDDGGGNTFTDDDGSIFEDAIAKLAAAGITKGCNPPDNTKFCPNANVTRGQMAAFLGRAAGLIGD